MVRNSKQRYRTNCQYFNSVGFSRGKYGFVCWKPWYRRCPDVSCPAHSPTPNGVRRIRIFDGVGI